MAGLARRLAWARQRLGVRGTKAAVGLLALATLLLLWLALPRGCAVRGRPLGTTPLPPYPCPDMRPSLSMNCSAKDGLGEFRRRRPGARHLLAVLIPYRERELELYQLMPLLEHRLARDGVDYVTIVVEQTDAYKFNRAALMNVAFEFARAAGADYVALHDVDRFAAHPNLVYDYPGARFVHLTPAWSLFDGGYPEFLGGIGLLSADNYARINGMGTDFWGWGAEDDDLYRRVTDAGIPIDRPCVPLQDQATAVLHFHSRKRTFGPTVPPEQRPPHNISYGLNTTQYTVEGVSDCAFMFGSGTCAGFYLVRVRLHCNEQVEPWCRA